MRPGKLQEQPLLQCGISVPCSHLTRIKRKEVCQNNWERKKIKPRKFIKYSVDLQKLADVCMESTVVGFNFLGMQSSSKVELSMMIIQPCRWFTDTLLNADKTLRSPYFPRMTSHNLKT